ncbi:MAG: hypothetical protein U9Q18_04800 [Caldisericota bacterium]|nr:hypothetical protein [Caldisericota bacterium]
MKKKSLIILIIILTAIITLSVFFFKDILHKRTIYNSDIIIHQLSEEMKSWIVENNSNYYKDFLVETTPEAWVFEGDKAEIVFNTKIIMTLKAEKVDDLPTIKGMLRYLDLKKGELSQTQIDKAEISLDSWRKELKNSIGNQEVFNFVLKAVANIDSQGNIIKSTLQFFVNTVIDEEPHFVLTQILTPKASEEWEEEGFALMEGIVENTENVVSEDFIPFLVFKTAANSEIKAYLNYWDSQGGKIISTGKVVYTVPPTPYLVPVENWAFPLSWDGESYIILPDTAKVIMSIYQRMEKIDVSVGSSPKLFGNNLIMIKLTEENDGYFHYLIKIWNGEQYVEKEMHFTSVVKGPDGTEYSVVDYGHPVVVYNDGDNINVLISYSLPAKPSLLEIKLLLYTWNINSEKGVWHNIFIEEGAGPTPSSPIDTNYVLSTDNKFYCQAGWSGLQLVDIKNYFCKLEESIMKFKKYLFPSDPYGKILVRETFVLGLYKDIKIIGIEDYICAIKNNNIIGILVRTEDSIQVMAADKKVISEFLIKDSARLKFPNVNGKG